MILFGITREHCRDCRCEIPADQVPLCADCLRAWTEDET